MYVFSCNVFSELRSWGIERAAYRLLVASCSPAACSAHACQESETAVNIVAREKGATALVRTCGYGALNMDGWEILIKNVGLVRLDNKQLGIFQCQV